MKWPAPSSIINGIASFKPCGPQPLSGYAGAAKNQMNGKILHHRTWLNLIGAIILLVGLASAALIYHRAAPDPYGAMGYEGADGTIYPIMPGDSKLYRHNLEVYGGKFSVIMDDFRRWFIGLWQGKSLAVIIAGTAILLAWALFAAAQRLTPPGKSEVRPEPDPDGAG